MEPMKETTMNERDQCMQIDLTHRPMAFEPIRLRSMLAKQTNPQTFNLAFDRQGNKRLYRLENGIAVIDVSGALFNGEFHFMPNNGYTSLKKNFLSAIDDPAVEAILFNLDSPGGEAGRMFDLSDAIFNVRGIKPIWAIANEIAFSAAYGIASATDRIYVTRTGGVGSVGVIAVHLELSAEFKMTGWNFTMFRGGKYKAEQNWIEPLTEHAKSSIQDEVDRIYGMFVDLVARNRGVSAEKIRDTEANLYFGENAIQAGLADREGNYDQVMADLKTFTSRKGNSTMSTEQTMQGTSAPTTQQPVPPPVIPSSGNTVTGTSVATQPVQTTLAPQPAGQPDSASQNLVEMQKQAAGQARAEMQEIIQLCNLARRPEMAMQALQENLSPDQVREKLISLMADDGDRLQIDSRYNPDPGAQPGKSKCSLNTEDVYKNFNARPRR